MVEGARMCGRAMPTAKAEPLDISVKRAEVLNTLRKQGLTLNALIPSPGRLIRDCLRRGYDLIHQVLPAPSFSKGLSL